MHHISKKERGLQGCTASKRVGEGRGRWASPLPKAVEEEVLYCPRQLVSGKQTRARARRAEGVLLAGVCKGFVWPPTGLVSTSRRRSGFCGRVLLVIRCSHGQHGQQVQYVSLVLHKESNVRQKIKIKSNVVSDTRPVERLTPIKVLPLIPSAPRTPG